LEAWVRLVQQEGLLHELVASFKINIEAILISSAISIGLAYLTVLPICRPFVEFLSKARFFALAGFVGVFTMAFGGGHGLKLSLLVFAIVVFFLTTTADIVAQTSKAEYDHARSLRMGDWRIVWEIIVLGKADENFDALRQNAAIGWMMLTMVEGLVRSEGGIGALMLAHGKYRHFDAVFAIELTMLAVGIGQDRLIGWLKGVFCPYSRLTLERR